MYTSNPVLPTTKEEIIRETYRRLREQGGPGFDGHHCLYRTPDNKGCALGVWIKDIPEIICFNKYPFFSLHKSKKLQLQLHLYLPLYQNVNFWQKLQNIHDQSAKGFHKGLPPNPKKFFTYFRIKVKENFNIDLED